jgi:hypothetical protein
MGIPGRRDRDEGATISNKKIRAPKESFYFGGAQGTETYVFTAIFFDP